MKQRMLGTLSVSAVGYGCMGLSHGYGPTPEPTESIRLIQTAYESGCTFFDTAESYGAGENEILTGKAVQPFRQHIVLATKLHILPSEAATERSDLLSVITRHADASLARLHTSYIDLYYLHRINPNVPVEDVAWCMGELIRSGKIRAWGLSQCTEEELRRAHSVTPVTAVQSEYSLMERMFEADVIPACRDLGIGFVPFSPLGAGFLSGCYRPE